MTWRATTFLGLTTKQFFRDCGIVTQGAEELCIRQNETGKSIQATEIGEKKKVL